VADPCRLLAEASLLPSAVEAASARAVGDVSAVPERRGPEQLSLSSVATRPRRRVAHSDGAERRCEWCSELLPATALLFCSKNCRQTAFRARQLAVVEDAWDEPKRLGLLDPPYVGLSKKYDGKEPSFAGEVDHEALIAAAIHDFDGWALACSMKSLRYLLPLCPDEARVCTWFKPNATSPHTRGIHALCEAVIVVPARLRKPGVSDHLEAKPARGGGTLKGRKPIAWCMWVFALLGASPMDELDDRFPGTGVVTRAFRQFQRAARANRAALLRKSTPDVRQR
jgi:hypothetical protein